MTQAQRKKQIEIAEELVAQRQKEFDIASEALTNARAEAYTAKREYAKNQPITKSMEAVLVEMVRTGKPITRGRSFNRNHLYVHWLGNTTLSSSVADGLLERELITYHNGDMVLSDWGKEVLRKMGEVVE